MIMMEIYTVSRYDCHMTEKLAAEAVPKSWDNDSSVRNPSYCLTMMVTLITTQTAPEPPFVLRVRSFLHQSKQRLVWPAQHGSS